ncbi:AAA family ATPase [Quadrisphaera sp. DSM 44207]|uniref:HelD family protein n=1 Tax=Quadrisphaera sp. DSM 44207 TaxID=1881057 RepID=UPI00088F316D|nr:AAA family ATPase [Quadrisphaera sp. DSM 44207]SDQ22456.1 DNA helicase IV [Quadrisphaera sp. DSM 44207]
MSTGSEQVGERFAEEVAHEQERVDALYARLDELRELTEQRLRDVRRAGGGGTHAARTERDAFATLYEDRLVQLRAVEDRLAFGRLDLRGGADRYVGRIGLSDERQEPMLTDWRAPAAEPFYRATAADPGDVVRRRHLTLTGRRVTALEDDVLDADAVPEGMVVAGGGALLAAVTAHRTGRMRDIVATLQAEQDEVVRAPLPGVLVVQGGPGTGKTAVALHRAAYLLYAHRERIARAGVLVVGPNRAFLRYIDQVLPSLGETGVVMSTVGELHPGVRAVGVERDEAAAVKGDLRMVRVLAASVRQRQRTLAAPVRLDVEGRTVVLRPSVVAAARSAARDGRAPHNTARTAFVRRVLGDLVRQLASAQGLRRDEVDAESRRELEAELRASPDVRREVNLLWMPLTPTGLLADLYARPERLARAAEGVLSPAEAALCARERSAPFTPADVPLLDELAELLGDDADAARAQSAREAAARAEQVAYARGVLEMAGSSGAGGLLSAEALADRWNAGGPDLTVAERAAADRTWTYGHVVVDEAQELSAMAWRLLARRCPSRSMTVVGDVAQTSSAAGASDWERALAPVLGPAEGRPRPGVDLRRPWRLAQLTVNYRTPRQVMELAGAVLAAAGVSAPVPRSIRDADVPPRAVRAPEAAGAAGWLGAVAAVVRSELDLLGSGRMAVVAPDDLVGPVHRALVADLPDGAVRRGDDAGDAPVTVAAVAEVKGLEFDAVVLAEPAGVLAQSARGANDLYVALTRPTQRLVVVSAAQLPAGLDVLAEEGAEEGAEPRAVDPDAVAPVP